MTEAQSRPNYYVEFAGKTIAVHPLTLQSWLKAFLSEEDFTHVVGAQFNQKDFVKLLQTIQQRSKEFATTMQKIGQVTNG